MRASPAGPRPTWPSTSRRRRRGTPGTRASTATADTGTPRNTTSSGSSGRPGSTRPPPSIRTLCSPMWASMCSACLAPTRKLLSRAPRPRLAFEAELVGEASSWRRGGGARSARRASGAARRDRRQRLTLPAAIQLEAPEERDRVVQVTRERRGDPLEHLAPERAGLVVAAAGEVHEGQVPQEMIAEPAELDARFDPSGERGEPLPAAARLVEHVRERVHGPRVPRFEREGRLGGVEGLVAAALLLEGEGVEAEPERVACGSSEFL